MVRRADPVTITCLLPTLYGVQSTEYIQNTEHYANEPFTSYWTWNSVSGSIRSTPKYTTKLPGLYRIDSEFYRCSSEMLHPTSIYQVLFCTYAVHISEYTAREVYLSTKYGSHLNIRTLQLVPNCAYVWLRNLYSQSAKLNNEVYFVIFILNKEKLCNLSTEAVMSLRKHSGELTNYHSVIIRNPC